MSDYIGLTKETKIMLDTAKTVREIAVEMPQATNCCEHHPITQAGQVRMNQHNQAA